MAVLWTRSVFTVSNLRQTSGWLARIFTREGIMSSVQVIKAFFESNGGRKVEMPEFRALSTDERRSLADQAAVALGLSKTVDDKGVPEYK
jgi:hypothetical protein